MFETDEKKHWNSGGTKFQIACFDSETVMKCFLLYYCINLLIRCSDPQYYSDCKQNFAYEVSDWI